MPRLYLIHVARIQVVSTCIYLYRLSPSTCIGDKTVVTAACIHLYPCTSIRIQVDRPGYLYPATCIWCKRGFTACDRFHLR